MKPLRAETSVRSETYNTWGSCAAEVFILNNLWESRVLCKFIISILTNNQQFPFNAPNMSSIHTDNLSHRPSHRDGNLSHRPSHIDGNLSQRPFHRDGNLSHRPSHIDGNLSHRPSHKGVQYMKKSFKDDQQLTFVNNQRTREENDKKGRKQEERRNQKNERDLNNNKPWW